MVLTGYSYIKMIYLPKEGIYKPGLSSKFPIFFPLRLFDPKFVAFSTPIGQNAHFSLIKTSLIISHPCDVAPRHLIHKASACSTMQTEENNGGMDEEVPKWAVKLLCEDNTRCSDGECEKLHVPEGWKERKCKVPSGRGKLIVCAGPQRSGSTWLFNAARFLLQSSGERVHSYWLPCITDKQLYKRGFAKEFDAAHIVIKTHAWSDEWTYKAADLILVTDRDICDVLNSYLRVRWRPYDIPSMKSILQKYLNDHKKWKSVADFMISYDDLSDVGGRELDALNHIQRLLNNGLQADAQSISALIRGLAVPSHGAPDPITKLWPRHISSTDLTSSRRVHLSEGDCKDLREYAATILD